MDRASSFAAKILPAVATLLLATPALAQKELWSCNFVSRCNDSGCEASESQMTVQLNTESGSAVINYPQDGDFPTEFTASVLMQGDVRHVVLDNESGVEVTTMTAAGPAMMTGTMTNLFGPEDTNLVYYRLEGTCTHDQ